MRRFNNKAVIKCEYVPLEQGDEAMVKLLWPLYKSTGEANGFCVLSEKEFADFHLKTPALTVMLIRDVANEGRLVTFCTGVQVDDTLMPLWCGTDYENPLAKQCSTYFNMCARGRARRRVDWIGSRRACVPVEDGGRGGGTRGPLSLPAARSSHPQEVDAAVTPKAPARTRARRARDPGRRP